MNVLTTRIKPDASTTTALDPLVRPTPPPPAATVQPSGAAVDVDRFVGVGTTSSAVAVTQAPIQPSSLWRDAAARGQGSLVGRTFRVEFGTSGIGHVDLDGLLERDPVLARVFDLARSHNVTVGTWGGTTRDLLMGRPRSASSDVDLVFDSSEPRFAAFATALKELDAELVSEGSRVKFDLSVDRNPAHYQRGLFRELTINKLAILGDGSVTDFTGRGLEDLRDGVLRYSSPNDEPPGINTVVRIAKLIDRYPDMHLAQETKAEVARVLDQFYGPTAPATQAMRGHYEKLRLRLGVGDGPLTTAQLKEALRADRAAPASAKEPGGAVLELLLNLRKIAAASHSVAGTADVLEHVGIADVLRSIGATRELAQVFDPARTEREKDIEAFVADLRTSTLSEGVRYALRVLSRRFDGNGNAAAAQLFGKLATGPLDTPSSRDPTAAILAALPADLARYDISADDVKAALKSELFKHRAGEGEWELFDVVPVEVPDDIPAPHYGGEWVGSFRIDVDVDAPHSMANVDGYVADRVPLSLVKDAVQHNRPVEIWAGPKEWAFSRLSGNYDRFYRVLAPKAHQWNHFYLAVNTTTGASKYFVTEINGTDRFKHVQHLLARAAVDVPGARLRLGDHQVMTMTDSMRESAMLDRRYAMALKSTIAVPSQVVIGFKRGIERSLQRRGVAARKLAELQRHFGAQPLPGLVAELRKTASASAGRARTAIERTATALEKDAELARTLRRAPKEAFAAHSTAAVVERLERILQHAAGLEGGILLGGELPVAPGQRASSLTTTLVQGRDPFLDQSAVAVIDAQGRRKNLLLLRTPYGDTSSNLGRALGRAGASEVFLLSTGGALDGAAVGDVVVEDRLAPSTDQSIPAWKNGALLAARKLQKESNAKLTLGGTVERVSTPLEETIASIEAMRGRGGSVVSMELEPLMKGLADGNDKAQVSSLHIISDRPGTAETLESHTKSARLDAGLEQAIDVMIEKYGIRDIELVETSTKSLTPFGAATKLAAALARRFGAEGAGYEIYRYNLARYLVNGMLPSDLQGLAARPDDWKVNDGRLDPRWAEKIERSASKPYKNEAVRDNLRDKQTRLAGLEKHIESLGAAPGSYRLVLIGSLTKGRFGADSDLDVLLATDNEKLREAVFQGPFGYKNPNRDKSFAVGNLNFVQGARGDHYRPLIDLSDGKAVLGDPDFLSKIYAEGAEAWGQKIILDGDRFELALDSTREAEREVPTVVERLLEYDKTYRPFRDENHCGRYLSQLDALEHVGALTTPELLELGRDLHAKVAPLKLPLRVVATFAEQPSVWLTDAGRAFLKREGVQASDVVEGLRSKTPGEAQALARAFVSALDVESYIDLLGVTEPFERFTLWLHGAEAARTAGRGGTLAGAAFAEAIQALVV